MYSYRARRSTMAIGLTFLSIISRETGEQRWWVCDRADRHTCHALMADNIPTGSMMLYTDVSQSHRGSHPPPRYGFPRCA
jgi:hypothetical protein